VFKKINELLDPSLKYRASTEEKANGQLKQDDFEIFQSVKRILQEEARGALERFHERLQEDESTKQIFSTVMNPLDTDELIEAATVGIVNAYKRKDVSLSEELVSTITENLISESKDSKERLEKLSKANHLFSVYLEDATRFGEIIISEKHKSHLVKMIKPTQIGGIAGGEKFIAR
jgi:hypothetical protein